MHSSVEQDSRISRREPELGPVSVAICAYTMRRWDNLTAAVASVVAQLRPGDECLVVVDHNDELLARAATRYAGDPSVRVLASTGTPGLSGARNTAVADSVGVVVAFLDDDAVAGEHWLGAVLAALAEEDVLGVGTAAWPHWSTGARPGWFPPEFDWVVGCSYRGLPTERADVRNVIGAAMAFRREAFEFAGTFSSDVGRIGTTPTGCEETELCIRLRRARPSTRITYLPEVSVRHHVTADRLTVRYFFRRCFGEGLSKARVSRLVGSDAGLSSERSYVRSVLPRAVLRELRRSLRGEWAGAGAAALIVAGVLTAGAGYLRGRLARDLS
jgi:glycosyltransferase involved in cell wall biosynthesis